MMQGSVADGLRSGNAKRACCPAPNSGNREGKRRLEFVNVTMPVLQCLTSQIRSIQGEIASIEKKLLALS